MPEYDAVVYDLDGTLVRLDVDWAAARDRCARQCRAEGIDPDGLDLWEILEVADERGFRAEVEPVIAEFEREGGRSSRRLPLADDLPAPVPVGVCSLNAERACRIALDRHGLADHVDAVVGRDTLPTEKPDPEPLREAFERLGTPPGRGLFVGDSESDAETARRAGVAFQWADDRIDDQATDRRSKR